MHLEVVTRRIRRLVLGGLALGLVVAGASPAGAQISGERIRSYAVSIQIDRTGSLLVAERIVYDFAGTEHHGILRDVPVTFAYNERFNRVYPLKVLSVVGSPGTPDQYKVEKNGAELEIKIGDPDKTITGRHTYTITYRVDGAMNGFPDHDELYWNAIGTEWSVPIDQATVQVRAPAPIQRVLCFAGYQGSRALCESSASDGAIATFRQSELQPDQGLTVVLSLPKGAVAPPHPILKEKWSIGRAFAVTPLSVGLGGGLLVLVLAGLGWLFWVTGRDRRIVGSPVDIAYGGSGQGQQEEQEVPLFEHGTYPVEYAPPDGIRPGQVGTLIDEVANPLDVTATIIDLAVRGYIQIEEIPRKGWFGKPDWRLIKLKDGDASSGDGLIQYERLLLDSLFQDAAEDDDDESGTSPAADAPPRPDLPKVRLSSLRQHFVARLAKVEDALYDDAMKRRWFAGRPDKVRKGWASRGTWVLIAGIALTWLAAARSHLGLVPLPLVVAGLLMLWGSHRMPRRTPKGTGMVRRVKGFRTYIETAESQEAQFQEKVNLFSQYLPYAVVFGCTEKWARAFGGLAQLPPTPWYVGIGPFTIVALSSSIDNFSVSATGTIASSPASSGSSGFGGGGFSGGGGGGGGGGSW